MKRDVILQPAAERELNRILAWLYERSPEGAATWYDRWLEVLVALEKKASGLARAPEDDDHEATIQQMLFKTRSGRMYRALFTIHDDVVHVIHLRGPGQDLMRPDEVQLPQ